MLSPTNEQLSPKRVSIPHAKVATKGAVPLTSRTGLKWRLGLLVTTLVMGAALITSGIDRRQAALASARSVTEAEVYSMLSGARRELVRARGEHEEILTAMFDELGPRGVRYLSLIDSEGRDIFSLGRASVRLSPSPNVRSGRRKAPLIVPVGDDGLVHAFISVGRSSRAKRRDGSTRRLLAIELIPEEARRIVTSAERALLLEFGAAVFLLLAALVFWRMSRRAEKLSSQMEAQRIETARQLERDRQLKLLGQMSAVLGHELRNPITALKGNAQLLTEKLAGHPTENRAREVVDAAVQLEHLTGQVLDFARTGELNRSRVYVDDLLNSVATFAGADPVEIRVPDDLPPWSLDRDRMERVLVNLLQNARQASPDEAPVKVSAWGESGLLVLEVRDEGEGIAPGDEERIFEPFYTSRAQGTGLGLALARRVTQAHRGDIRAYNHEGGGAVFKVEIPQDDGEEGQH
jgi:two-component system, NtrC family, sensor histidine kinase HydH